MSFRISTYYNESPANKVDKNITEIAYGTGVLRDGCSIIDPIILFETELTADTMTKINYCYIEEFGRYYYITNIFSVTNDLWELHLHVDVLMTYREQLRKQSAIVSRQTNKRNMYVDDGWFIAQQNPHKYLRTFSNATPFENQEFVLAIAGS